jgi:hypothetical protein
MSFSLSFTVFETAKTELMRTQNNSALVLNILRHRNKVNFGLQLGCWEKTSDDGPPRKWPKHVVDFNNLKIQLCYDGHIHT